MAQKKTKFQYYVGGLLRIISNDSKQIFTARMSENGVSLGQWMVLRTLYETDMNIPSDVADYIGFTRGAISKLVDKLSQKKLIIRKESSEDRRYQEVELTEKAKTLVPRLIRIAEEHDKQFLSCLNKTERKNFRQMLDKIVLSNNIKGVPTK